MDSLEIIQLIADIAVPLTIIFGIITYLYSKYMDRLDLICNYYIVHKPKMTEEYWEIRRLYSKENDKSNDLDKLKMGEDKLDIKRNMVHSYLTKMETFAQIAMCNKYNLKFIADASGKNLIAQFYFFSDYIESANDMEKFVSATFYLEFYALIIRISKERNDLIHQEHFKSLMEISYFNDELANKYKKLYKWKTKNIKK